MKKLGFILAGGLLLSACSSPYSTTGENIYLRSQNGPLLVIHEPLTSRNISSFYILAEPAQSSVVSLTPPGLG